MSAVCLHLWYHCQLFDYTGTNVRIWYINTNKARFTRNVVKWDNFANFQTPWNVLIFTLRHKDKSQVKWIIRLQTTFLPFFLLAGIKDATWKTWTRSGKCFNQAWSNCFQNSMILGYFPYNWKEGWRSKRSATSWRRMNRIVFESHQKCLILQHCERSRLCSKYQILTYHRN